MNPKSKYVCIYHKNVLRYEAKPDKKESSSNQTSIIENNKNPSANVISELKVVEQVNIDVVNSVILDNGSGMIKAGFSGEDAPRVAFVTKENFKP